MEGPDETVIATAGRNGIAIYILNLPFTRVINVSGDVVFFFLASGVILLL